MRETLETKDGTKLHVYCWDKVQAPKAMIQIFHGMAEHAGRYKEFAEYLNAHGFIVYASDHRGHGKTAGKVEDLGYIGEDGFNAIVEDKHFIFQQMKQEHPELPMFLIGHSFGSFLSQEYIIRYGRELNGVILSGSAMQNGLPVFAGGIISSICRLISGEKKQSKFMDSLSFGTYNKRCKNDSHKFAWLSTDQNQVKKYAEDPFCGTVFTVGFFYHFLKGLKKLYKRERLASIPGNLPIFIVAGDEDPVGSYGKSVKNLFEMYKELGMTNVNLKLYPGLRHEILNEVRNDLVYLDLLDWLNDTTN